MRGLLVVCEGLDAAGKTTTIKKFMENKKDNNFLYNKGLGSPTFIGKLAKKFPSTLMFLLDLIYIRYKIIQPALRKNKIILQDRYDFSILSYNIKEEKPLKKKIINFLRRFLLKPDALVYFQVSLEERIKRLKNGRPNKYHALLSKNPNLIKLRENKYLCLYHNFKGNKTKINTTGLRVENAAKLLEKFIM